MDIKKYIWSIWDIAAANDKDVGVGLDMLLANVREGRAKYPGADDVDYQALKGEWETLGKDGRKAVYATYDRVMERYHELAILRNQGDRDEFQALVEVAEVVEKDE